jgi:hypothetical protein
MIRGALVNWYPYPFLNPEIHGYSKVLINITGMISVFFIAGILLVVITRTVQKNKA